MSGSLDKKEPMLPNLPTSVVIIAFVLLGLLIIFGH